MGIASEARKLDRLSTNLMGCARIFAIVRTQLASLVRSVGLKLIETAIRFIAHLPRPPFPTMRELIAGFAKVCF